MDSTVRLWDVETGENIKTLTEHTQRVESVSFSPDGGTLASGSNDQTVRLWDVETGQNIQTLEHTSGVFSISFSPDGGTLASYEIDTIRLWDVSTGKNIKTIDAVVFGVSSVSFSPDGGTLASVDGNVRLWDVATGENIKTLSSFRDPVESVSFSPDGTTIASGGSWNGLVFLWDVETGENIKTLTGHTGYVHSVSFSPDGTILASGSWDETIRLWDIEAGENIKTLTGHRFWVNSVSFSPDGSTLASGGRDETIRLWDIETGENIQTLTGHTGEVYSVSFSPQGSTIASGSRDGTVLLWRHIPKSDATVRLSPASMVLPSVGEQLTLSLEIVDAENVAGYQAKVSFDNTALRYVSGANGDFLPAGAFFVDPVVEGNLIMLNAASLAGDTDGDGTLATLTFEVITATPSTLTLSDVLLTNSAGFAFVPWVGDAKITEPPQLKEDVNADGIVNIQDLVLVASNLGKRGKNDADVNRDGLVNIQDLVLVASALGTSAAAPSLHSQALSTFTAADIKEWLSQAKQLNLTDATSQQGIRFLEQLLAALIPKETALLPNYPNPFNPETWIPYQLAAPADVTVHIYGIDGTLVRTLALGHQVAGMYQPRSRAAYWDGRNALGEPVASGVYFYTLTAGDFTATRKMLIRK